MFRQAENSEVYEKALLKPTENYFILQSLLKDKSPYQGMFRYEGSNFFVLLRKTGTIQIFFDREPDEAMRRAFCQLIEAMPYTQIIGIQNVCHWVETLKLPLLAEAGSYIAFLDLSSDSAFNLVDGQGVCDMTPNHLLEVETLYSQIFSGHASAKYMADKLSANRGRGKIIKRQEKLLAVAQSDFETPEEAVIVGVATDEASRNSGLGTKVTAALCQSLLNHSKQLGLIYENEAAGRIYERLGFVTKNRLYHMKRSLL